jgi:hypothetical protein
MHETLADAVLVLHVGVVVFVIGGLLAVLLGNPLGWRWVNARAFRYAHLGAIGCVVAESWLGIACPLTTLEAWLRLQAGGTVDAQGFIAGWLQRLLFWTAPTWVFTLAYTAFGALVAWAWWRFPPRRGPR